MSLLIHLPLEGNLNNLGTETLEFTATNPRYITDNSNEYFPIYWSGIRTSDAGGASYSRINSSLSNCTFPLTACCWYKHEESNIRGGDLFDFFTGTGSHVFAVESGGAYSAFGDFKTLSCHVRYKSYWSIPFDLYRNRWVHIAQVCPNAQTMQIYINGALVGSYTGTSNNIINSFNDVTIKIGDLYQSEGISDFRFYNTALTAAEIKSVIGEKVPIQNDSMLLFIKGESFLPKLDPSTGTIIKCIPDSSLYHNTSIITNPDNLSVRTAPFQTRYEDKSYRFKQVDNYEPYITVTLPEDFDPHNFMISYNADSWFRWSIISNEGTCIAGASDCGKFILDETIISFGYLAEGYVVIKRRPAGGIIKYYDDITRSAFNSYVVNTEVWNNITDLTTTPPYVLTLGICQHQSAVYSLGYTYLSDFRIWRSHDTIAPVDALHNVIHIHSDKIKAYNFAELYPSPKFRRYGEICIDFLKENISSSTKVTAPENSSIHSQEFIEL